MSAAHDEGCTCRECFEKRLAWVNPDRQVCLHGGPPAQPIPHLTGAVKADTGKPAVHLLPFDALVGAGNAFGYGEKKYSAHNWSKGMAWSRLLGAALRHIFSWATGEDNDPESGLPHLDHAAASILMLSATVKRNIGADDRWKL